MAVVAHAGRAIPGVALFKEAWLIAAKISGSSRFLFCRQFLKTRIVADLIQCRIGSQFRRRERSRRHRPSLDLSLSDCHGTPLQENDLLSGRRTICWQPWLR